jgi:hypothetical protein
VAIKMPLDPKRKLSTPIPSVYLFEEFCTPQEERYLLTKVEELGGVEVEGPEGNDTTATRRYKDKGTAAGWRVVKGRRQAAKANYWLLSLCTGKQLTERRTPNQVNVPRRSTAAQVADTHTPAFAEFYIGFVS